MLVDMIFSIFRIATYQLKFELEGSNTMLVLTFLEAIDE